MSRQLDEIEARIRAHRAQIDAVSQRIEAERANGENNPSKLRMKSFQRLRVHLRNELVAMDRERLVLADEQDAIARGRAEGEARVAAEDRAYWFRRFHTSLAIAHGGAMAAISSKLLDSQTQREAIQAAVPSLAIFAVGMVLAGTIPYALSRESRRVAGWLANLSAGLFVVGLVVTILALARLAWASG